MSLNNSIALEDDEMCFACGRKNPSGLNLKFEVFPNKTIETRFIPQRIHQGFKNIVHGGIISLILDEAMLNLLWKINRPSITAYLEVNFKKAAKVGELLIFKARIYKEQRRLIYTKANACLENGIVVAESKAKCFRIKPDFS